MTASFGLAVANEGDAPAELLQRADAAMYRAKAVGGAKVTMFEADTEMSITTLADELAIAVSHGLIRPHVQSVIDLKTGRARRLSRAGAVAAPATRPSRRRPVRPRRREHAAPSGHRPRGAAADGCGRGAGDAQRSSPARVRPSVAPVARRQRRRALSRGDHRRPRARPLGSLRRDRAFLGRATFSHGRERASDSAPYRRADRAHRCRRRVRGQRDRRVRLRRAPAGTAPRPRRRPRPDPPARVGARDDRARPRTRPHRDRRRHRERGRTGRPARRRVRLRARATSWAGPSRRDVD